jgi:hypothetical protein
MQFLYDFGTFIIITLIGSGGAVWRIVELRKTKKSRKHLSNELSSMDKKQNKNIKALSDKLGNTVETVNNISSDIENIKRTVLNMQKIQTTTNDLLKFGVRGRKISVIVCSIISSFKRDKQIKSKKLSQLYVQLSNIIIESLKSAIDNNLKYIDVKDIRVIILSKYDFIPINDFTYLFKNSISINKSNFNCKEYIEESILDPELTSLETKLAMWQMNLTNGDLFEKVEEYVKETFVPNIIIQIYNLYKESKYVK